MSLKQLDIQSMVYGRDPLVRTFARITGRNLSKIVCIAGVYQLVTKLIPAVVISCYYNGKLPFISVFQFRELTMVGIWEVALPLIVFAYWAWQPVGVEVLITRLRKAGVAPMLTDDNLLHDFLEHHIAKPLNQPWTMGIAILSVIPVFLLGPVPNWFGAKANPTWWSINPLYYWGIYSGTLLFAWYVFSWALIRQVVVVRALYVLFRDSEIRPKLMHPDGCMGFSPVGKYAFVFCFPIILFAFSWALSLVFMPVSTGKDPTLISTCLCIVTYPFILSVLLRT